MMKKRNFVLVAMAFAVVADLAVAQTSGGMSGSGMGGMSSTTMIPPELAANPAVLAYAAAMDKMMTGMQAYTGDADVDFVKGMIPHHEAAVAMAKAQLEFGKDPAIRKIAEAVIAAQEAEIGTLKTWLAARGM